MNLDAATKAQYHEIQNRSLKLEVALLTAALAKLGEAPTQSYRAACAALAQEQERWRRETSEWMEGIDGRRRKRLTNQRRELKRLNKQINMLRPPKVQVQAVRHEVPEAVPQVWTPQPYALPALAVHDDGMVF